MAQMREQGHYNQPAPAAGCRKQPQNVVRSRSPRKQEPPKNPAKTPAPVKGKAGSPGSVAGQKGAKMSAQESAVRKKVRKP